MAMSNNQMVPRERERERERDRGQKETPRQTDVWLARLMDEQSSGGLAEPEGHEGLVNG